MILSKGLIVSCQAYQGDPLFGTQYMAAMAKAAEWGGAVGIRANSPQDIRAIRQVTSLPIIGIYKISSASSEVYITPDINAADQISQAGCDIIAIDATPRPRPNGVQLSELISHIKEKLGKPVMADISCLDDAITAEALKADYISTTLSGYTAHGRPVINGPDLELVAQLVHTVKLPVIAEGRIHEPAQAAQAIKLGAHAVVVGEAITRPEKITQHFITAMQETAVGKN